MSAQRSELVAGVYRYLGNVPDGPMPDGCPLQTVFQVLSDCESELLRDVELSDQNRRVDKFDLRLGGATFTIPRADFHSPAYAFLRTDEASDLWYPVEITNHAALNEAGWGRRLALAFYCSPQKGEVSWEPAAGQTLRVWYDRSGEASPVMAGQTDISSLYDSLLVIRAAAQCRELMGLPVGPVLAQRLAAGGEQWRRHANSSRQQTTAEKPMAFPLGRGRRWSPVDHSRFFLP